MSKRILTVLVFGALLAACDSMIHREIVVHNVVPAASNKTAFISSDEIELNVRAIDAIASKYGFYKVDSRDGAFRTYDMDKEPIKNRGSFTFFNVFLLEEANEIKIVYVSFPASRFSDVAFIDEINVKLNGGS